MVRTAKSQQLREAAHETGLTKPRTGLACTSYMIKEQKDVDQNLLDNIPLHRIKSMCWRTFCDDVETAEASTVDAIRLYESLEPQDSLEAMLSEQMVGTHLAVTTLLERANLAKNVDLALKYMKTAAQFQGQFVKQLAALDKHRGRNPQKVVVEHVHVEAGGQAIVGHVETKESRS